METEPGSGLNIVFHVIQYFTLLVESMDHGGNCPCCILILKQVEVYTQRRICKYRYYISSGVYAFNQSEKYKLKDALERKWN